jgi:hypothetical protein
MIRNGIHGENKSFLIFFSSVDKIDMVQLMLGACIYFWKTSKFIIFELRRLQKNFFWIQIEFL